MLTKHISYILMNESRITDDLPCFCGVWSPSPVRPDASGQRVLQGPLLLLCLLSLALASVRPKRCSFNSPYASLVASVHAMLSSVVRSAYHTQHLRWWVPAPSMIRHLLMRVKMRVIVALFIIITAARARNVAYMFCIPVVIW